MRVQVTVTNDDGQTFEGEADLAPAGPQRGGARRARPTPPPATPVPATDAKIDFTLPRRAFLKKHARGSGPAKFAVLLAHMTGGRTGVQVTREAVAGEWRRNRGLLGGNFRGMYATRAKGEGWTDSAGRGTFVLRADWRGALE